MSHLSRHISSSYISAWHSVSKNWHIIGFVYIINLLLAFIAIGPLSNLLDKAFSNTTVRERIVNHFDFSLIGDFMREYEAGISISISNIVSFVILYLLWSIFYQGAWVNVISKSSHDKKMLAFWQGGGFYFLRYFRLTLYVMIIVLATLYLAFLIFTNGELNPLHVDSEVPYINRFWFLVFVLSVLYFLLSIFRDYAKLYIAKSDSNEIYSSNLLALKRTIKLNSILLALINGLVLVLFMLIYIFATRVLKESVWIAVILGQIFLVFRLVCKYVRLQSFFNLDQQLYPIRDPHA